MADTPTSATTLVGHHCINLSDVAWICTAQADSLLEPWQGQALRSNLNLAAVLGRRWHRAIRQYTRSRAALRLARTGGREHVAVGHSGGERVVPETRSLVLPRAVARSLLPAVSRPYRELLEHHEVANELKHAVENWHNSKTGSAAACGAPVVSLKAKRSACGESVKRDSHPDWLSGGSVAAQAEKGEQPLLPP